MKGTRIFSFLDLFTPSARLLNSIFQVPAYSSTPYSQQDDRALDDLLKTPHKTPLSARSHVLDTAIFKVRKRKRREISSH